MNPPEPYPQKSIPSSCNKDVTLQPEYWAFSLKCSMLITGKTGKRQKLLTTGQGPIPRPVERIFYRETAQSTVNYGIPLVVLTLSAKSMLCSIVLIRWSHVRAFLSQYGWHGSFRHDDSRKPRSIEMRAFSHSPQRFSFKVTPRLLFFFRALDSCVAPHHTHLRDDEPLVDSGLTRPESSPADSLSSDIYI